MSKYLYIRYLENLHVAVTKSLPKDEACIREIEQLELFWCSDIYPAKCTIHPTSSAILVVLEE